MMSRNGVPNGTSARPVFLILPARAKTFVPLVFSVPMRGIPRAAAADDGRNGGPGFDVVDVGRFAPETALGRERRTRHAAGRAGLRWSA